MVFNVSFRQVVLYLLPMVVFVTIFLILPIFFILVISPFEWDGVTKMTFIGFGNFSYLWNEQSFRDAFVCTIYWIISATFLHTTLGLVLTLILYRLGRAGQIFRTIFFLPNILSVASLALLWFFLLNPYYGLINNFFKLVGLDSFAISWLSNPKTAAISTQLPFILYIGFTMLIFYANISTIPRGYYEAAEIDGASSWQQDLYITLPLIRRAIVLNVILNVSFILKMVEYPLIMTGGGPGGITTTLPLYIFQQMSRSYSYGKTMAAAFITFITGIVVLALVYLVLHWLDRKWA